MKNNQLKQLQMSLYLLKCSNLVGKRFTLKDIKSSIGALELSDRQIREVLKDLRDLGYIENPMKHRHSWKFTRNYYEEYVRFSDKQKAQAVKKILGIVLNEEYFLRIEFEKEVKQKVCNAFGIKAKYLNYTAFAGQ